MGAVASAMQASTCRFRIAHAAQSIAMVALYVAVLSACDEDGTHRNSHGEVDVDAAVSCGELDDEERGCCPSAWKADDRCDPGRSANACWTACSQLGDSGTYARGTLACGTDGVIAAGQGLYPCRRKDD